MNKLNLTTAAANTNAATHLIVVAFVTRLSRISKGDRADAGPAGLRG